MSKLFSTFGSHLSRAIHRATRAVTHGALMVVTALLLSSCESSVLIVNDLDERDANEMIVFLVGHHIDAEKIAKVSTGGGSGLPTWNVSVKKSDRMHALTLLNNNGLPRRRSLNLLDLFEKQGLVSSELEERIRYQSGLAAQIASTIRKIDGVLDADVQISFPQEDSLPGNSNKPVQSITASVYVKHQGILDNPNSHLVLKIKRLVASAIPGLDFDQVTVVADRAVFNDPMSLALNKEPDLVSVWGVSVVHAHTTRLQMIVVGLLAICIFALTLSIWMLWKVGRILPSLGGFSSLFKMEPWQLSEKSSEAAETSSQASVPAMMTTNEITTASTEKP